MLTFRFTGAGGQMTEYELLTAGMTGKQVRFLFSSEWDGLQKVAVYRAGDISCVQEDVQELDTIPARVLSKSLRRLYVGVYGVSEDGRVVIPTVFVPGPFIHIGAAAEETPGSDPDFPGWAELEQALEETVRFTPQTLTEQQQAQARANIGVSAGGLMNGSAAALLLTILRKAVYTEDVSQAIVDLEEALSKDEAPETPEEPEIPEVPETVYYSVSCSLEQVTATPALATVAQGESCTVTLTAAAGYVLESVTVTMGGSDITGSVYSGGLVTIPAVTGNVVITAVAVAQAVEPEVTEVPITLSLTKTSVANNQRTIALGERYVTAFIPEDGYYLEKVTVSMGGEDVTDQVLTDNGIVIPSVTGAIFIIAVAVAEPGPVTIQEIIKGTTSFDESAGLLIHRGAVQTQRATLLPAGQYLKKGTTYRFGLGNVSAGYSYGIQIFAASSAGLVFSSVDGQENYYGTVTSREVDTGWMQSDYTYTPTEHNRIFTMNFKHTDGNLTETHFEELLANVVIEEVTT